MENENDIDFEINEIEVDRGEIEIDSVVILVCELDIGSSVIR